MPALSGGSGAKCRGPHAAISSFGLSLSRRLFAVELEKCGTHHVAEGGCYAQPGFSAHTVRSMYVVAALCHRHPAGPLSIKHW